MRLLHYLPALALAASIGLVGCVSGDADGLEPANDDAAEDATSTGIGAGPAASGVDAATDATATP